MSRRLPTVSKNNHFVARFVEACGGDEPAEIQRLLGISYQAAKNYLNGRVPEPTILVEISKKTDHSIHWLLTGEGDKYVGRSSHVDTNILTREMEASVRQICVEVINEALGRDQISQPRIVVLPSDKLLSEKAIEESPALSENQP